MHRQPLLHMLQRYLQRYPDEAAIAEQITHLVHQCPNCFERTCRPGHITGSAWVLSTDQQRCLLVHHRRLDRWLQPGGHADGECHVEQVALREAQEESGVTQLELVGLEAGLVPLDIDVHAIPARHDAAGQVLESAHAHHDIRFLVRALAVEPLVASEESHAVRWFTRAELLEVTSEESVLRMCRKAGPH